MQDDNIELISTSRRNFTKAILTAAVAAPMAASLVGCQKQASEMNRAAATATPGGPSIIPCGSGVGSEEHIPPMELDGSGSLRLELSNKLATRDTAPPFRYFEDGINNPNDRYGELESVLVISEFFPKVNNQYIDIQNYVSLPSGSELLLWYQKIYPANPPSGNDPDVKYENVVTFPPNDHDVRIIGGPGNGRYFQMILKHKALPPQPDFRRIRHIRHDYRNRLRLDEGHQHRQIRDGSSGDNELE